MKQALQAQMALWEPLLELLRAYHSERIAKEV